MYSMALVMAFLAAEDENRQLEALPQANFARVSERLVVSGWFPGKEKVSE